MIKRKGFKNFSRKVDGNVNVHEAEGSRGWKYTRYGLLDELAACRISWLDYSHRLGCLSSEEQLDYLYERLRRGIPYKFNDSMGSYEPLRIALEQTSEPIGSDPAGERQAQLARIAEWGRIIAENSNQYRT